MKKNLVVNQQLKELEDFTKKNSLLNIERRKYMNENKELTAKIKKQDGQINEPRFRVNQFISLYEPLIHENKRLREQVNQLH